MVPSDGGHVQGGQRSVPDLLDVSPTVQQCRQQLCLVLQARSEPTSFLGQALPAAGSSPALASPAVAQLAVAERAQPWSRGSERHERLGELCPAPGLSLLPD